MLSKAQIKYIQSLQHKKYRQKSGQFIAEGDKIVQELLQAGQPIQEIYATTDWITAHQQLLAAHPAIRVLEVDTQILKLLSSLITPNRAMALLNMPVSAAPLPLEGKISLALDALQDPGNMGTIIRIADWFGIQQVICSPDCVDVYNPKTIQATMGSLARVHIAESSLQQLVTQTQVPSYAATLHGEDITGFAPIKEGIIVIGNEGRGIGAELLSACTHRITIPRLGGAESLNAAVATGIICGRMVI
jgi:TrmH family RNA methyltransferase